MRWVVRHEHALDQGGANYAGHDDPQADDHAQEEGDAQEEDDHPQVDRDGGGCDHKQQPSSNHDGGSRDFDAGAIQLTDAFELTAALELTAAGDDYSLFASSPDPHELAQEQGLPAVLRLLAPGLA